MAKRSKYSSHRLQEHFADPYVQRAQAEGPRSRAVCKLEAIERKERVLEPGMVWLEPGAVPGARASTRKVAGWR